MNKFLIPLLANFLFPATVEANWFGDKTFYLSCNKTHHKFSPDGKSNWSNWIPLPKQITNQKHCIFANLNIFMRLNTNYFFQIVTLNQITKKIANQAILIQINYCQIYILKISQLT